MPKRLRVTWRTKGGVKPPNVVYVGRPSLFGNPFVAGRSQDAAECVRLFRLWLAGEPASAGERFTFLSARRAKVLAALPTLRGKDLACYCGDGPCHADVLLELANSPV